MGNSPTNWCCETNPNPKVSIAAAPLSETDLDPVTQVVVEADLGRLTQVVVEADLGRLTQVSVLGPDGVVPGILSDDGSRWSATGARRLTKHGH